jgi:hypothetical protein
MNGVVRSQRLADRIHLTVRPTSGAPLSDEQLAALARVAHAETHEVSADGSGVLGFSPDRYSIETARDNLAMAARMTLGAHWRTRYEIADS